MVVDMTLDFKAHHILGRGHTNEISSELSLLKCGPAEARRAVICGKQRWATPPARYVRAADGFE